MSTNDQTTEPSQDEVSDEESPLVRWLEPSPPLPVDDVERPREGERLARES